MRAMRLIAAVLFSLALSAGGAHAQSSPNPRGAWDACKAWVTRQLYEPEGLRFPQVTEGAVAIQTTGRKYRPNYLIRSYALLPNREGIEERIPFSCLVHYGVDPYDLGRGYIYKRLTLPDSTVVLPRSPDGRSG